MCYKSVFFTCTFLALCLQPLQVISCQNVEQRFKFPNSDIYLRLVHNSKLQYQVMKGSKTLQTVTLENTSTNNKLEQTETGSFTLSTGDATIQFDLIPSSTGIVHVRVSRNVPAGTQPIDCFDLDVSNAHWYGGPEYKNHYWPVEKQTLTNFSYVTKELENMGVAERYWLNTKGEFFYVEDNTPLFVEQNSEGYENKLCFSALSALPFNSRVDKVTFVYHIGIASNAKDAHMYVVKKFLGHPSEYPDERMVAHPIWSTWALYKRDINESVVRAFGEEILSNGFNNSQLEIDDDWEDCYGALSYRKTKFPDMKQLTDDLKSKGFRVTLWIHPFINKNCEPIYSDALNKGYLILDHNNNPDTQWWNSGPNEAAYVDFTKAEVRTWFSDRLKSLQEEGGIDSFKFDAGESSWMPSDPVLQGDLSLSPTQMTRDYVRTVGAFGPMVEVRSGQNTQDLPIFVRIVDKDSEWGWNNGLLTLITTMLQMNLNGYPFVLPDMIGGNGYDDKPPSKELFLRWLQANVFMPSLQFSYVPWNFDEEAIEISKKFVQMHADYAPEIIKRFKLATETGEPVNLPLWWVDPSDKVAQGVYDQFLLGDDIISAPVVEEDAVVRDIYLPKGNWKDGNTGVVYQGPKWLMAYKAPLDTLPYFVREHN
ncbi:myogenesis-regulating glycosidase-like isoform X3 [Rhagoletis pomonella]|uniref:myogenesis-regulating glycosidase-like isoform X3 n=1 Tax=Rhagoletis pomonella TaxID=28610 RepID=UPI00178683AD|nr:myogenesis-regulating glycosidase-like isoform X3 [Rhagoletis pomonella]